MYRIELQIDYDWKTALLRRWERLPGYSDGRGDACQRLHVNFI